MPSQTINSVAQQLDAGPLDHLMLRAKSGDMEAVAGLFAYYSEQLRLFVQVRLNRRIAGRLDASDVLQETYIDVQNRIHEFQNSDLPFLLWLRLKVAHRLVDLHRFHLGTQRRSARREASLANGASQLSSTCGPATNAIQSETCLCVKRALNSMSDNDRAVLVFRHFEGLTNRQVARALGISDNAASNRYVRALARMKLQLSITKTKKADFAL